MLYSQSRKYSPVATDEHGDRESKTSTAKRSAFYSFRFLLFAWLTVATLLVLFLSVVTNIKLNVPSEPSRSSCTHPVVRQEWRNVSREAREEYISAALCLHETPSSLDFDLKAKRSDDFPWAHSHLHPLDYHRTSSFLPWHRYFIHHYEKALRDTCGYRGHLLYWDWTLDHEDPPNAPVFDVELGFGGDGDPKAEDSISGGSCIREGPLHGYEVRTLREENKPHCLSRGFGRSFNGIFSGPHLSPTVIKDVLQENNYYDFLLRLENGPHNDVPLGIGGDWLLTAPNDPVFFLHHTQIDRLWWTWQQANRGYRMMQYTGPPADTDPTIPVLKPSLEDILTFSPLAKDIKIRDLMSTESDLLCYRY